MKFKMTCKRKSILKKILLMVIRSLFIIKEKAANHIVFTKYGKDCQFGEGLIISEACIGDNVSIGNSVTIGPRSHIYTNFTSHDFIYTANEFDYYKNYTRPFDGFMNRIGNRVWIGRNAIILPGVRIDDDAVILEGSIVTKSVPENTIVGGNPAKYIRMRQVEDKYFDIVGGEVYCKSIIKVNENV